MKRRLLSVAVLSAGLAVSAPGAASATTTDASASTVASATTVASAAHSTTAPPAPGDHRDEVSKQDRDWLTMAAASDLFEIESGRLAERQASDRSVRVFASHLVRDHTKAYNAKKDLARRFGVRIPDRLSKDQERQLRSLRGKHGRDFDKAYLEVQVKGHREAVSGTRKEIDRGRNRRVVGEGKKEYPIIAGHLREATSLLRNHR